MNRQQLEHVIREVGRRIEQEYFYIIGSTAILATLPNPTDVVLYRSRDVDVLPGLEDAGKTEELADRLDRVFGEASDFDFEYGYYVQGVTPNTPAFAPQGWEMRAIPVKAGNYTGLCMEAHDLALSKYGAGREKDLEFNHALVKTGILDKTELLQRLNDVKADEKLRSIIHSRIERDFA